MDTLLPEPTVITIVGDVVFVADELQPAVVGLRLSDGVPLWRRSRRGQGPGDLASPIELLGSRPNVAVLDLMNRRIAIMGPRGDALGATSLAFAGSQPNTACAFGKQFMVADVFRSRMLVLDSAGVPADSVELPWPDLRSAGMWSRQVMLRSDANGERCLVALMSGRGFAVGGPRSSWRLVPYVEQFEVTGIGERASEVPGEAPFGAALDADFSGDSAIILFAGRTKDEYRTLDFYSWSSAQYLLSVRLPIETSEIAIAGPYVIARLRSDSAGTSLIALRRR